MSFRVRRPLVSLTTGLTAASLLALPVVAGADPEAPTCPTSEPLVFAQDYIDTERAGGEPIVVTHPDGQLLWGSHAGTTHFYSPAAADTDTAAFVQNYQGQTYQYVSDDDGASWDFVPRTPIDGGVGSGLPNSGFSDPEFAIDTAGNVFISEINLANIAISRSSDGGRTYELRSLFGVSASDRQWMEADTEDVLWFVANTFGGGSQGDTPPFASGSLVNHLYKSTDGGATLSQAQRFGEQRSSDIQVDKTDGRLYQLAVRRNTLEMWIAPDAREQTPPGVAFLDVDGSTTADTELLSPPVIARGVTRMSSIGPTMALAPNGDLYVVWDQEPGGGRGAGVWYASSTDRGVTWSEPIQLNDPSAGTAFWPWIAAGDEGVVAVWLQHEGVIAGNDPEAATAGWHVMVAQSLHPAGCEVDGVAAPASFTVSRASAEPVHDGTICTGGTLCQAFAIDRRLGDYFANTVTRDGEVVIAVSDTRNGGAVSLPLVIRQVGGPTVGDPYGGLAWAPPHPGAADTAGDTVGGTDEAAGDGGPGAPGAPAAVSARDYVVRLAARLAAGA